MPTQTYKIDANGNVIISTSETTTTYSSTGQVISSTPSNPVGTFSNPQGGTIESKIAQESIKQSAYEGKPVEVSGTMQAIGTEPYKYGITPSSALTTAVMPTITTTTPTGTTTQKISGREAEQIMATQAAAQAQSQSNLYANETRGDIAKSIEESNKMFGWMISTPEGTPIGFVQRGEYMDVSGRKFLTPQAISDIEKNINITYEKADWMNTFYLNLQSAISPRGLEYIGSFLPGSSLKPEDIVKQQMFESQVKYTKNGYQIMTPEESSQWITGQGIGSLTGSLPGVAASSALTGAISGYFVGGIAAEGSPLISKLTALSTKYPLTSKLAPYEIFAGYETAKSMGMAFKGEPMERIVGSVVGDVTSLIGFGIGFKGGFEEGFKFTWESKVVAPEQRILMGKYAEEYNIVKMPKEKGVVPDKFVGKREFWSKVEEETVVTDVNLVQQEFVDRNLYGSTLRTIRTGEGGVTPTTVGIEPKEGFWTPQMQVREASGYTDTFGDIKDVMGSRWDVIKTEKLAIPPADNTLTVTNDVVMGRETRIGIDIGKYWETGAKSFSGSTKLGFKLKPLEFQEFSSKAVMSSLEEDIFAATGVKNMIGRTPLITFGGGITTLESDLAMRKQPDLFEILRVTPTSAMENRYRDISKPSTEIRSITSTKLVKPTISDTWQGTINEEKLFPTTIIGQSSIQSNMDKNIQKQLDIQTMIPTSFQPTSYPTSSFENPPRPPQTPTGILMPTLPDFDIGFENSISRRMKRTFGTTRYKPSLMAIGESIISKGRMPKSVTGLEIRPIFRKIRL